MIADPPPCERLIVDLGDHAYPILVGAGLIDRAGQEIALATGARRAIIVSDKTVDSLFGTALEHSLRRAGLAADRVVLPPGEPTKDFAHLASLCERVLALRIERSTLIVALGGGVIGDIAGFAAGILLRGLDFVQVPTTLLAQVDSAVGGKTGINTPQGKNLVGLFHQPRLVLADVDSLLTLPKRQLRAGYAEVIKYGLINDPAFFSWLEDHGTAVLEGDADARRHAVLASCRAKAAIVGRDERESGERALLNLGHTFGHALEAETGFGDDLLHGEAVAFGMLLAFTLSARLGLCPWPDVERVRRHLAASTLPTRFADLPSRPWTAGRLLAHMRHDKKVKDGAITFVLVRGIGRAFLSRDVPADEVIRLFDDHIAERG
ncbi:MAG: 3-dehydroquinate synthase [Rhodospirillales bacterium]|nr:3-dehydroquinate synthase [Rhodospirillales bacterium]